MPGCDFDENVDHLTRAQLSPLQHRAIDLTHTWKNHGPMALRHRLRRNPLDDTASGVRVDACGKRRGLDLRALHYDSHWLTPPGVPKRFDTRFFTAPMPTTHLTVFEACLPVAIRSCWFRFMMKACGDGCR